MASEIYNVIDALSREKGIDPQIVVSAVEDAIVAATRKKDKSQENLHAELDKDSGMIRVYAVKSILPSEDDIADPQLEISLEEAKTIDANAEVGGEVRFLKSTEGLGRISSQIAKQVIFQKVREAERDTVYNEYIGRVGEILNATVKRIEGPDVIFDIGKAEARMGRKEQSRLESFAVGERVRVVLVRVEKASKGPQVVVSRAAPQPAKVSRVTVVDATEKHLEVIVDDTQLSLAIGKKGQNVRLAAKLLGWKIDIKSEEEKRQEVEQQMQALTATTTTPLEKVPELGEQIIEKLVGAGITTVEALADMTPEQLEELPGIGPKTIEKISIAVNNYFSALEGGEGQGLEPGIEAQESVAVDAGPDVLEGESIELPNVHVDNSEYEE